MCERCTATTCCDDIVWLECEACGNRAAAAGAPECVACGGRGKVKVEGCVRTQIRPAAWDLLEMVRFTDDGTWPKLAGVLEQTPAYLRAYRWVRMERAAVEAEIVMGKK